MAETGKLFGRAVLNNSDEVSVIGGVNDNKRTLSARPRKALPGDEANRVLIELMTVGSCEED